MRKWESLVALRELFESCLQKEYHAVAGEYAIDALCGMEVNIVTTKWSEEKNDKLKEICDTLNLWMYTDEDRYFTEFGRSRFIVRVKRARPTCNHRDAL